MFSKSKQVFTITFHRKKQKEKPEKDYFSSFSGLVGEGGFEPPKASPADLQSVPFGHSGIPPNCYGFMELVDGLEPPTC